MGIDFDSNNPVVRDLTLTDSGDGHKFGAPYFDSKTIRIDDQDDLTILLRAGHQAPGVFEATGGLPDR